MSSEGLFQNFADDILDRAKQVRMRRFLGTLAPNRIVTLVIAPPELIVERIRQRERLTGDLMVFHRAKADAELQEFVRQQLRRYQKLAEALRNIGFTVNTVDATTECDAVRHTRALINRHLSA